MSTSTTPRTDAVWEMFRTGDLKDLEPDVEFSGLARQLEHELQKANERIKRLEEAGDCLNEAAGFIGTVASGEGRVIVFARNAIQEWRKAKEAKP